MGNHDRVRVGTRYPGREDQMIMLEMILPGVAVTYYGEEIGMVDDTELRIYDFRDGCRTPFQWDDSLSAGKKIFYGILIWRKNESILKIVIRLQLKSARRFQ